jgi:hypothetical protein
MLRECVPRKKTAGLQFQFDMPELSTIKSQMEETPQALFGALLGFPDDT